MSQPAIKQRLPELKGANVTLVGIGQYGGGLGAIKHLLACGAILRVTDQRDEASFADSEAAEVLGSLPAEQKFLGGHPFEAFDGADLVVLNPAIREDSPVAECCRRSGATTTTEIELFLAECPSKIVAVTGSNGKSTTSALIHHMLQGRPGGTAWLGGNIGGSLLSDVKTMQPEDVVVLELSSFQLARLKQSHFAPDVAVVTNFTPNHLDWHPSIAHYKAAKQVLLKHQSMRQWAVLPADEDSGVDHTWAVRGRSLRFGTTDLGEDGVYLTEGLIVARDSVREDAFRFAPPRQLPGEHNRLNIAAAAAAAWAIGQSLNDCCERMNDFAELPHRLQVAGTAAGITFVNDSCSTTPESAIAALRTMSVRGPVAIIAGGASKNCDLSGLADAIGRHATGAVLIGETAAAVGQQLAGADIPVDALPTISEAVARAVELLPAGGIVLLSPGCSSYGMFRDYRDRGDQFLALARQHLANL